MTPEICDKDNKCVAATTTFTARKRGGSHTAVFNAPSNTFKPAYMTVSTTSTDGACFSSVTYKGETISLSGYSYCGGLDVDSSSNGKKTVSKRVSFTCTCANGTPVAEDKCTKIGTEQCASCKTGYSLSDNKCVELLGGADENGCMGGYKWCETKNKCLQPWIDECPQKLPACKYSSAGKSNDMKCGGSEGFFCKESWAPICSKDGWCLTKGDAGKTQ